MGHARNFFDVRLAETAFVEQLIKLRRENRFGGAVFGVCYTVAHPDFDSLVVCYCLHDRLIQIGQNCQSKHSRQERADNWKLYPSGYDLTIKVDIYEAEPQGRIHGMNFPAQVW